MQTQEQKRFVERLKFGAYGGFVLGTLAMLLTIVSTKLAPFVTFSTQFTGKIPVIGMYMTSFMPLAFAIIGAIIAVIGAEVYELFKIDKYVKERLYRTAIKFVIGMVVLVIFGSLVTNGLLGVNVLIAGIVAFMISALLIAIISTVIYNQLLRKAAPM